MAKLSLIPLVAVVLTEVRGQRGGWSLRMDSTWSRTRSSMGSRMLMEGIQSSFIWNLTRGKSCKDHVHTLDGDRLPNLVCKFPEVFDILSHQVGAEVWRHVVEE